MLHLQNLTFSYPNAVPIFAGYNWQVGRGEAWAVLGPSGCGKSTLLALIAGLLPPAAGRVLIEGQPLARPRPHTGLIIQDYGLLPWATVRENAELGLRIRNTLAADGNTATSDVNNRAMAGAKIASSAPTAVNTAMLYVPAIRTACSARSGLRAPSA